MKKILVVLSVLMVSIILCTGCGAEGNSNDSMDTVIQKASQYIVDQVPENSGEDEGSAWNVLALKWAGDVVAEESYYTSYYDSLRGYVKSQKGILDATRYTTYERVSMALTAMGYDPTDVEGYDLMAKVDEYEKVKEQGINAEIYALIAANYTGYSLKNEAKYCKDILEAQGENGGITLDGETEDVDITAMAIQALSFYKEDCAEEIQNARAYLSSQQLETGDYGNAESTAQVILAVASLGEDPTTAEDFTKEDTTLEQGLMNYWTDEAFCHTEGEDADLMATQQGLMALAAIQASQNGSNVFNAK